MKYKAGLLLMLFSLVGFAQSETTGKIKTVVVTNYELGYVLHKPVNTKEKKPLIVFISGDGEKGTDLEKVKINGPLKYAGCSSCPGWSGGTWRPCRRSRCRRRWPRARSRRTPR